MKQKLYLFISHLSSDRRLAKSLAKELKEFNIIPFVAHEDIAPTSIWQDEIEKFLDKADCMIAILTKGYFESIWCNQEIGFCLAGKIPLISVRVDEDPKGFIGKWQAYTPKKPIDPRTEAQNIEELVNKKAVESSSIRQWLINSISLSSSYYETNRLCTALKILDLTVAEEKIIKNAYINNSQVQGANDIFKILDKGWIDKQ